MDPLQRYHRSFLFFRTLLVILVVVPVISTIAIPKELGRDCRVGCPKHGDAYLGMLAKNGGRGIN